MDDINFEKKEVRLGTRKTKDGSMEYDWLPMSDDLYRDLISFWKDRQFKESPYVFVCSQPGLRYGQPFLVRRKFLKGLCARAGVKPFGFHALRRYVAYTPADTHKGSAKTIQCIEAQVRNHNRNISPEHQQGPSRSNEPFRSLNCGNFTPSFTPQTKRAGSQRDNPLIAGVKGRCPGPG
jgi:hypothetical protein